MRWEDYLGFAPGRGEPVSVGMSASVHEAVSACVSIICIFAYLWMPQSASVSLSDGMLVFLCVSVSWVLLVGTCVSARVYVLACLHAFNLILCPCHCMTRFVCCMCRSVSVTVWAPHVSVSVCVYFSVQVSVTQGLTLWVQVCLCPDLTVCPCCPSPALCLLPQGEPLPGHHALLPLGLLPWPASPERGPRLGNSSLSRSPPSLSAPPPARPRAGYKFPALSLLHSGCQWSTPEGPATSPRRHCHP